MNICTHETDAVPDPASALERYFSLKSFREPQEAIIQDVLAGRDTLVVMPTGGGKSLCYQLPALLLPGVTLVVSPLIALMKDQVDALRARGLSAGLINSQQTSSEQMATLDAMRRGEFKLIYVAPERFRAPSFLRALPREGISLFAVDEAHCLSQWGHDFRPDYMKLNRAREALGNPPCIALTATATPDVQADIIQHLQLRNPVEYVAGFERPNLSFRVVPVGGDEDKFERIDHLIETHRTGIIYCATRKAVEAVAERLELRHRRIIRYHGGLRDDQREAAQNAFMSRAADVVVATNAFGMGIDRSDIRFVCHYEMPGSVEAYYQEGGRAGRDGQPGTCEMLFSYADKRIQDFFIEGANPGIQLIRDVLEVLTRYADKEGEVRQTVDQIIDAIGYKVNPMAVSTAISILSRHQLIERFDIPGKRLRGTRVLPAATGSSKLPFDAAALAEKKRRDEERLNAVLRFGYARQCRQEWILRYFGEKKTRPCGRCDQCRQNEGSTLRVGNEEERKRLLMALSGVARCSHRTGPDLWEPRFGRGRIIRHLLGSKAQDIVSAGLDNLSTFGLLKECGKDYVTALFDAMERGGLLEAKEREGFSLLGITPAGARAMREGGAIPMHWPEAGPPSRSAPADAAAPGDFDTSLYHALVERRLKLAVDRGVPAYTIFPNAVLEDLARIRPRSAPEARGIKGIGAAKERTFLSAFLAVIREQTPEEID